MTEMATSSRISIVLADDHGIVRAGLRALLESQPDMRVVGEAGDGPQAISLARELRPNVLIADLSMPGGGLQAIKAIADLGLPTRVLVLTFTPRSGISCRCCGREGQGMSVSPAPTPTY
jgi:DNA-binding NarL/FixJ family response regulator